MILIILVGPPGSGKSTFAANLAREKHYHIINQDTQGKTEHFQFFLDALALKLPVVIDRMNFNKQQRERYIKAAREAGYEVHIHLFFVPQDICLSRCVERTGHPTIKEPADAERALRHFFKYYERPAPYEYDTIEMHSYEELPKKQAIIVDLDGTLCNIDHRLPYVRGTAKKDWDAFFKGIPGDTINTAVGAIVDALSQDYGIVYCSGRPVDYEKETMQWLKSYQMKTDALFMRPEKNYQPDSAVKEAILDFELLPRYNIIAVLDDRRTVVDMWRRRGLTCLQVNEGDF